MLSPVISVVMSVYNSDKYLSASITSILEQSFKNFEFIVINDASTDNSLKIITKFMKKDSRIFLENNDNNLGLTKSLNKGLKSARGKYIVRQDADDISLPRRLEKQYSYLVENGDYYLIGTGAYIIDESSTIQGIHQPIKGWNKIKRGLPKRNIIYHPSIMFKNNGISYRDKFVYSQDYDMYLRLLSQNKKMNNLDECLIMYRVVSTSITQSKVCQQRLFAEKAKQFYYQRISKGKDRYQYFNSCDILHKKNYTNNDKKVITKSKIESNYNKKNYTEALRITKKYLREYGFANKFLLYYLLLTVRQFVFKLKELFNSQN